MDNEVYELYEWLFIDSPQNSIRIIVGFAHLGEISMENFGTSFFLYSATYYKTLTDSKLISEQISPLSGMMYTIFYHILNNAAGSSLQSS